MERSFSNAKNVRPSSALPSNKRNRQGVVFKPAQVPLFNFSRIRPKQMLQEKEQLYDQTLSMKKYVNYVKEQNLKLQTQINIYEVI